MDKALHSSGKDDWETPQDLFAVLNVRYNFTLDPCATPENAKCERYFALEDDGLSQSWQGHTVFCNPPYSKKTKNKPGQEAWIRKAYIESQKPDTTVVMLLPARTDTKAFHEYIYRKCTIEFIKGRIKFVGAKYNAPFPCMIVTFKKDVK